MADIIDELLNSGSVDSAALAAQLRRQKEYGMVGALSGSSRLAPFAGKMQADAMGQAADIGGTRSEQAGNAASAAAALDRWKTDLASKEREGKLNRDQDTMLRREGFASAESIANIRARNAKKDADEARDYEGKKQVSDLTTSLRSYYDTLNKGDGIVSTAKGGVSNLLSSAKATGVGQTIGGALGTDNQQMRAQIKQQRPLLLQAIKAATGMSAQQMNSDKEMQLWLGAATDPTVGYEANLSALDQLDNLYGLGGEAGAAVGPAGNSGNPAGVAAAIWAEMTPEERALWPQP